VNKHKIQAVCAWLKGLIGGKRYRISEDTASEEAEPE
jgi:hypothetical protein